MTREEAVKAIKSHCYFANLVPAGKEALDMAIKALEQEPKTGHWIKEFNDLEGETKFICSSCKEYQPFETDFCYHCGSDNRGRTIVKES